MNPLFKRAVLPRVSVFLILAFSLSPLHGEESWRPAVESLQQAFRHVSRQVLPVVVEINVVDRVVTEIPQFNPWQFFFGTPRDGDPGQPLTREYTQTGLGSGVIIDQRGARVYVITNYHVAGEADEIRVSLYDGRQFEGELAGVDKNRDLALVTLTSEDDLPLAELGDSDTLMVGDWVMAVGNPYGFESTITQGIISARGRLQSSPSGGYSEFLQTDAAINAGNYGGALVNLSGEVIGINTWIASQSGGSVGLGFAIPINNVKNAIDDLLLLGNVKTGWLGILMGTLTDSVKDQLSLREWEGAFIHNIYADSPARHAGLSPGDLIIALDGVHIRNSRELMSRIGSYRPEESVKITYIREGREYTRSIVLGQRDDSRLGDMAVLLWPGFSAVQLTAEMRSRLGLSRSEGNLIIASVEEGSEAEKIGLKDGDIIKSINRASPKDLREFYALLSRDDELSLRIVRRGYEFTYDLKIAD